MTEDPAIAAQRFYEENRRLVTLTLTLEEATIVACAVGHHRDNWRRQTICEEILRKIEEACK